MLGNERGGRVNRGALACVAVAAVTWGLRKRFGLKHQATAGDATPLQTYYCQSFCAQRSLAFYSVASSNRDLNRVYCGPLNAAGDAEEAPRPLYLVP